MEHRMTSETIAQAAAKVTATGGVGTALLWFFNTYAAVFGIGLTLCALMIQFYYRRRADVRAEERPQAEMKRLSDR